MCRLYGFHGSAPTRLWCGLVGAQNALMAQSREDGRGESNADGWGIGYYQDERPVVEKCDAAAYGDDRFSRIAEGVSSPTVLAHVRNATVGIGALVNTHPFSLGVWLFAHNGTLTGFDRLEPTLEREAGSELLSARRGTTDSELIFLWLLKRMARSGIASDVTCRDPRRLADVLGQAVGVLAARSEAIGPESPATLNFLVTDGATLAASRWGNSLFYLAGEGIHSCGICGASHVDPSWAGGYRAGAIASEPISAEDWREVPEHSFVIIGPDIGVHTGPISPPRAGTSVSG